MFKDSGHILTSTIHLRPNFALSASSFDVPEEEINCVPSIMINLRKSCIILKNNSPGADF